MKPVRPPTPRQRARPIRTANPRMQDLTNGELSFEDSDSDIQQVYPPVPIQPSTSQHRHPVQRTAPFSVNGQEQQQRGPQPSTSRGRGRSRTRQPEVITIRSTPPPVPRPRTPGSSPEPEQQPTPPTQRIRTADRIRRFLADIATFRRTNPPRGSGDFQFPPMNQRSLTPSPEPAQQDQQQDQDDLLLQPDPQDAQEDQRPTSPEITIVDEVPPQPRQRAPATARQPSHTRRGAPPRGTPHRGTPRSQAARTTHSARSSRHRTAHQGPTQIQPTSVPSPNLFATLHHTQVPNIAIFVDPNTNTVWGRPVPTSNQPIQQDLRQRILTRRVSAPQPNQADLRQRIQGRREPISRPRTRTPTQDETDGIQRRREPRLRPRIRAPTEDETDGVLRLNVPGRYADTPLVSLADYIQQQQLPEPRTERRQPSNNLCTIS